MSKTVLVTGGAGFIGSNYCRYVLEKHPDYRVVVLDALTYAGNLSTIADMQQHPDQSSRFRFYPGKIQDETVVNGILQAEQVDYIVNFAAESHNDRSILDPGSFIQTDVTGVFTLLDTTKRHNVERLLHVSCYDAQTRALTTRGFKHYWEIAPGDEVLSLHPETGCLEAKPVEKVIVQDYQGEMIRFQSARIDLSVTPNHRMFYVTSQEKSKIRVDTAETLRQRSDAYAPRGRWQGLIRDTIAMDGLGALPTQEVFYLAGVFLGSGRAVLQPPVWADGIDGARCDPCDPGHGGARRSVRPNPVDSQPQTSWIGPRLILDAPRSDRTRHRLETTLCRLGIRASTHRDKTGEALSFFSADWARFFASFGQDARCRRLPDWMLQFDVPFLRALFDGLMDSGGRAARGCALPCYSTSSEPLIANLCELACKLGLWPRFEVKQRRQRRRAASAFADSPGSPGSIYDGSIYDSADPVYRISFSAGNIGLDREVAHTEPYRGKIWCLTVCDNKNFLVERGGKLVYCGNTDEVYGTIDDGQFTEQSPLEPNTPYSASKAGGELQARAHRVTYGTPSVITRCGNNFGPFQYPEKLIPFFVTRLIDDKKVPLYGTGQQVRDWVYVMDHCSGIDHVLHHGALGEAYNIGSEGECPNIEITHRLLKLLNKPESLIKFIADPRGGAHDKRYSIDASKLRALGWKPVYAFEEALEHTVRWYVENSAWWRDIIATADYQAFVKRFYGPYLGEDL